VEDEILDVVVTTGGIDELEVVKVVEVVEVVGGRMIVEEDEDIPPPLQEPKRGLQPTPQ